MSHNNLSNLPSEIVGNRSRNCVEELIGNLEPYDPASPPERFINSDNSLKAAFGRDIHAYVNFSLKNGLPIRVVELICPDYPHDGNSFTYEGEVGDSLNPTVINNFLPMSERLIYGINRSSRWLHS